MTALTEQLRTLIRSREYRAGERLPAERELANHFDVSRPKVRRAIATLVEHGVLEARDRSGVYIRETNPSELLAARLLLEPWAAGEAARLATEGDRTDLKVLLADAAAALNEEVVFSEVDGRIHSRILALCNNTVVSELYTSLQQRISASRGRTASSPETRKLALADLTRLIEAIEHSDASSASAAMRSHLERLPTES